MPSWRDAIAQAEIGITYDEATQGWPQTMMLWWVAQLQRFDKPKPEKLALFGDLCDAMDAGAIQAAGTRTIRLALSGMKRDIDGERWGAPYDKPRIEDTEENTFAASEIVRWLRANDEAPSVHVRAWYAATSDAPAPQASASPDTPQHQRQARRWRLCIDAGLPMPTDTYTQLPRGISKIAEREGITRQGLAQDLNAYRERTFDK